MELLKDRGILPQSEGDKQKFFHPLHSNEHSPELLDHMEEAWNMLEKHLMRGSKIYLVVDPDVDGYTSSSLVYLYLTDVLAKQGYEFEIEYHIPEGKEHGLQTLMPILTADKIADLIICPDSSSNDYEEHQILSEMGYDILVLDHHEAERYSDHAVVINNQLSKNYPNKALSGVGVVYKFLEHIDYETQKENLKEEEGFVEPYSYNYLDLVALGEISDVMDMTTLENRWIVSAGLSNINNKFFQTLIDKQSFSLKSDEKPLDQIGVAFYITPLINALIRVGSPIEKERLFQAFITPDLEVPSTKRGEKGRMETIAIQAVRNCTNAKSRQTKERDKASELLDIQIMNNNLDENKILILDAADLDVSNNLTGLCAMNVAAKYKKPVLLGRITPDGKEMRGSIRNKDGSPLKDLKSFLSSSGLMSYVEGHANAAGWGCPVSNIDKLIQFANQKLADVDFNEGSYDVDFICKGKDDYISDLIFDLEPGSQYWGQGNPEPAIAVTNISVPAAALSVIGQNKDTLRFNYNGITYVKFKCKKLIETLPTSGDLLISIVGRGNINKWAGRETPQIMIDDIEIKQLEGF